MPSKLFAEYVQAHPDLASEPVRVVSYMVSDFIKNMLADGEVDHGFGFGEGCLDFTMDGEPMRVVVKLPHIVHDDDAHGVVGFIGPAS